MIDPAPGQRSRRAWRALTGVALRALTGVAVTAALAGCVGGPGGSPSATPAPAEGSPSPATGVTPTAAPTPTPTVAPTPTPAPTPAPSPSPTPEPTYRATIDTISDELRAEMVPSVWREGCPVRLSDLRHLTMTHWDLQGRVRTGEMVVHRDVAREVTRVFERLFEAGYPVRQMRMMQEFDGDVDAGLAADNTSSFNCRKMLRSEVWSEHAYGRAIDVNPRENPYWDGRTRYVNPPNGRPYVWRRGLDHPTAIHDGDAVVRAFAAEGWKWGGHWDAYQDWMHFSPSGV